MWTTVARVILRNRILFLIIIAGITIFMGYKASFVRMSYTYAKMLPLKDTASKEHLYFKSIFKEKSNNFVVGIKDDHFFELEKINELHSVCEEIKEIDGVIAVLSPLTAFNMVKDAEKRMFTTESVFSFPIKTQKNLDKSVEHFYSLPFYKGLLYNDTSNIFIMDIALSKEKLNTKERTPLIEEINKKLDVFAAKYNIEIHYSGMPYIRTEISKKIKSEIGMFTVLALLVSFIVLFLFFRSFKVMLFSGLIVIISVIWALGSLVLFNYEITILTGMIPPLLIVIGIPNSIFLLNKYHAEYKLHGNKIKALQRVIQKIGNAIFLTNLTTAAGFATFIITSSDILKEFGIIASINIMGVFVLALLLIPIFFSFLDPPKERHVKHLDRKGINVVLEKLVHVSIDNRKIVYIVTVCIVILGFYGITRIKSTGYMVDDIPHSDRVYKDLKFFEKHFAGVIPFEILIDTKRKKGVLQLKNLKKFEKLEKSLSKYPEFSRSLSISSAAKFARQAFYNGNPRQYRLPDNMNKNFILSYIQNIKDTANLLQAYVDSGKEITRISLNVADVGTKKLEGLYEKVRADVNIIFPPDKYNVILTGNSVIYLRGTEYLVKNLFISLGLAIFLIAIFMAWMFSSARMILISLIPNLIPLLLTAALMGFLGIPIKPSTILVFSIAFGISVDNTIHFLAKYRQELEVFNWEIKPSVEHALREAGVSMIYTSIVLFFGFGIFTLSGFGGTSALGMLVSITLMFSMFSNLVLLPSLLLTLEKSLTIKAFKDPLLDVFDEEEDIDFEGLRISAGKK